MTCIVGIIGEDSSITMGCDSVATGGNQTFHIARTKIFATDHLLIGHCGSPRAQQLVQYVAQFPEPPTDPDELESYLILHVVEEIRRVLKEGGAMSERENMDEFESNFLVGIQGRLFAIHGDFQVLELIDSYHSIGSGSPEAFGSLYTTERLNMDPEERVNLALEAASYFNADVGGLIQVFRMDF